MSKNTLFLLCCVMVFLACTKDQEENYEIVPNPTAAANQFRVEQVINDSTIVLKWAKASSQYFQKYRLYRTATYVKNGVFGTYTEPVDSSDDINHLSFTETKMPLANNLEYRLYVQQKNNTGDPLNMPYQEAKYQRANAILQGTPFDVLISKQLKQLFVVEEQKISAVDYNGRILNVKEFPVSLGFCALGSFEGVEELYVPVKDGWLNIYNAETLTLKDRIYVGGNAVWSVVAAKGKLYVSSTDRVFGAYSSHIKVYDRATKEVVSRTGYYEQTRLMLLDSDAVEMVDVIYLWARPTISYYKFSDDGTPLNDTPSPYSPPYTISPYIIKPFPGGQKIITSASGVIINKSLDFEGYLKENGSYSDFEFNTDGSVIYTAYATERKIDRVSYPSLATIGSYNTNHLPYKIFRDGNALVVVSKYANTGAQPTYLFVEKINL